MVDRGHTHGGGVVLRGVFLHLVGPAVRADMGCRTPPAELGGQPGNAVATFLPLTKHVATASV